MCVDRSSLTPTQTTVTQLLVIRTIMSLSMALGISGCARSAASAPGPASVDLASRRAELSSVHEQLGAQGARDFIGSVTGVIASDGFYSAAVATVGKGPAAARTFLLRDTLNVRSVALWSVVRLDVSADGNDGYSYGYLDVVRPDGDTLPGAFKVYWRRDVSGRWMALALGRSRRERGPKTWLPDSIRRRAVSQSVWREDSLMARNAVIAVEAAFSDSAQRDMRAAFMAFAATDAAKIDGSRYVFGPQDIGEGFRTPPPGFAGIQWQARWGSVSAASDLAFNVGPVVQGNNAPGGLFFTIWKRQPDGTWRYVVD